jgi:hypothetical protein
VCQSAWQGAAVREPRSCCLHGGALCTLLARAVLAVLTPNFFLTGTVLSTKTRLRIPKTVRQVELRREFHVNQFVRAARS